MLKLCMQRSPKNASKNLEGLQCPKSLNHHFQAAANVGAQKCITHPEGIAQIVDAEDGERLKQQKG